MERGHIQSEVANTSSSTTLHFRSCQDLGEDDYIVLKGTTDFGEQSTRAASRQDKLHRRLPLIYLTLHHYCCASNWPACCCCFFSSLAWSTDWVWNKCSTCSHLSRILQKATGCAIYVWKHALEEALKGSRGGNAYLGTAGTLHVVNSLQVCLCYYLLLSTYDFVIERIQDVSLFNDVSNRAVIWAITQAPQREKKC